MKLPILVNNIKIGKNVKFIGLTHFDTSFGGNIIIGNNCTLNSSRNYNLIGVNRSVIFSTHNNNARILIGNNCGFSGTVIGAFISITIGDNVKCGANTLITDSDWHPDDYRSGEPRPIIIEDNVWIGEGVKVLKGVTIGENSLIGAGSVVTKNIPSNVIAAGNPCKIIKNI